MLSTRISTKRQSIFLYSQPPCLANTQADILGSIILSFVYAMDSILGRVSGNYEPNAIPIIHRLFVIILGALGIKPGIKQAFTD